MKVCIMILALSLITSTGMCQHTDSLKKLYINEVIYRYGNKYVKGGNRLSFQDLKNEFSFSPIGLEGYNLSRKHTNSARIFSLASLASTVVAISFISNRKRTPSYVAIGFQFAFGSVSGFFRKLATQDLDKALYQRNKDLLFGTQ